MFFPPFFQKHLKGLQHEEQRASNYTILGNIYAKYFDTKSKLSIHEADLLSLE